MSITLTPHEAEVFAELLYQAAREQDGLAILATYKNSYNELDFNALVTRLESVIKVEPNLTHAPQDLNKKVAFYAADNSLL